LHCKELFLPDCRGGQPRSPNQGVHASGIGQGSSGEESGRSGCVMVGAHADGNGFNIQIESVPMDARIALRIASEKTK